MSDKKSKFTRRAFLIGAATGTVGAATALEDGNKGNLTGGAMALSEPFNVSGKLWIGPDSAKSQVEAKSGRVYMASDTDVDYYADSGSWELRSVGSSQVSVPEIHTGQTSTESFVDAYSLSMSQAHFEPSIDNILFSSMMTVGIDDIYINPIFIGTGATFKGTYGGNLETVASGMSRTPAMANTLPTGEWVDFTSSGVSVYSNSSDFSSGTAAGTQSAEPPLKGSLVPYRTGGTGIFKRGWIWGEYRTDGVDPKIRRAGYTGGFDEPLVASSSRHCHSLDADPYNDGHMYATFGDSGDEIRWYKSTDYGANWSVMSNTIGDRDSLTLRINFDENYLYWATDDDPTRFYRAPRSDWTAKEKLFDASDYGAATTVSYGTVRMFDPAGILITLLDGDLAGPSLNDVPLFFYPFDSGTIRQVGSIPANDSGESGVHAVAPYQDRNSGAVFANVYTPNIRGESTVCKSIYLNQLM